jgi:hypothetical protein
LRANIFGLAWSADGKDIILSSNHQGLPVLWKVSASWTLGDGVSPARLSTFDLVTHRRTVLGTLNFGPAARAAMGFDISADGRTLFYTRVDSLESDIMLVEDFH